MVRAPQHVYSALIRNIAPSTVKVKVTYEMPNELATEDVVVTIQPGETVTMEQKLVQVSTATLTGHICCVAVDGGTVLKAPFGGVTSPVKDYMFEVCSKDDALHLLEKGVKERDA